MALFRAMIFTTAIASAAPILAQTALDRAEPTQAEEQDDELLEELPQEAPPATSAPADSSTVLKTDDAAFQVGSIIIEGNEALPDSEFVDIVERFTRGVISRAELAGLADAIAQRARDNGYVFATVLIPQQDLAMGVLRVQLDEGTVDEIKLEGAEDEAIVRQLAPLRSGGPVTRDRLERHILLADDISGVRILASRFEKDGDTGILIVRARRSDAFASVEVINNGSRPVGPVRARLDLDLNGVIDSADEIDLTVGTTPFQPEELQFVRGAYRMVVNASGLEIGTRASYSRTEPGSFLANRDIEGRFWRAGVEARYPLLRRRSTSVWAVGEFDVTDLRQSRAGQLARHDRVPAVRAGLYSRGRFAEGDYRGRLMVSRGLDILSATEPGDPLASRDDASAEFTSLYGWLVWDRPIAGPVSVALGARGQLASDPLLATEDLGLGGTSFLRGYNFNERSGDEGIMGFGELRYGWRGSGFWLPKGQVYAFADGGTVSNLEDGRGGGSLASAGGGIRLDLTRDLDLDVELAVPLTGERFDSESEAPLLNLRVEQSF
ncbi:ShlB/FhaC/HecB family hemolysin secretion/activation protein [Erythrobacter sp.]|jgi:hemolysin activation/secretion protein|uniref:ShlB/FhaC/HecB family hemolysin secretion/activation protein n=1 Tax=Erythrobacter sp. TaxID=1042 RepID=UPI002EC2EB04|nr:ShlB/FhaC/HecB family hemolysin secretion/activation protein [Erythrobacter sp.]